MNKTGWQKSSWILIIGDIVLFLLFALLGRNQHSEAVSTGSLLLTSLPFIVGWLIVGGLFRSWSERSISSVGTAVLFVLKTWVIAGPLSLGLRALFLWRGIPVAFAIVALLVNFIFLTIWRILAVYLLKKRPE
ncbi:MAG: hypothetical protein JWN30_1901 [Bacilli bacterium]|nr:hypothetical protein [Bacilli bacterium]